MKTLGNLIWFFLGGLICGLSWALWGALWCVTIIGIPYGVQCFKFAALSLWPFGRTVEYRGGAGSCIVNVIWFFFGGVELALLHAVFGLLWCVTIVGIPWGGAGVQARAPQPRALRLAGRHGAFLINHHYSMVKARSSSNAPGFVGL